MYTNKLLNAKKYFFISLYIDIFAIFLALGCNFYLLNIFSEIKRGRIAPSQALIGRVELVELFSKFSLLTMLCVGLALVNWLSACYKYARFEKGLVGFNNEKWIAAGWIIPLFNLMKPYQIINEIYRAGGSRDKNPEGWKEEKGSLSLLLWWIFWAVAHVIGMIAGKAIFKASIQQNIDIEKATVLYISNSLLLAGSVIFTFLWFWVSAKLTERLIHGSIETNRSKSVATAAFIGRENGAFAEALAEFEEGRLDKGVWARAFADAGGEESKAKALYIRARAEALKNDEVWQVTQPSVDESNLGTSGGGSNWDIYNVIQMLLPILKVGVIVIFVVVVGGFVSKDFRNSMYSIKSYFIQSFIKNSSHDVGSDEGWRSSVAELRRDIDAGKLSTRRMEVEIIKEPLDVLNYSQRAFMSKGDVNLIEENNLWWVEQNKIFIKIINHTGNIINGVVFDLAQSKCGTLMQQNELHLIFKFDASMLQPYSSVVYASELPFDYKQYFGTGVNCGVVSHVFTYR